MEERTSRSVGLSFSGFLETGFAAVGFASDFLGAAADLLDFGFGFSSSSTLGKRIYI